MVRTIVREKIPPTDSRLGRKINHDSESRRFPYRGVRRELLAVRHTRHIDILDQGNLGSCTAEAGIGCLATGQFFATNDPGDKYPLTQVGALKLYSDVTAADPYPGQWPPTDTGSDGLSIAKVLTAAGQISGYRWAFTLADALAALQDQPLITGINWYSSMFSPASDGLVRPTGSLAGGHEIVVDEYLPGPAWVGFTNSWGLDWGPIGGRFYMTAEDWGRLLDQQGDVTVFTPATEPAPQPEPTPDHTFAAALRPWAYQRHVDGNARAAKAARTWLAAKGL